MRGELRVRLAVGEGQTRVIESYAHAPFHYLPPAVATPGAGGPAVLTVVNSSGGVLGGDELDMAVALDAGTTLTLRTQAATKVYRSTGRAARSVNRFVLGTGAVLDYVPDEIIPFAGSNYEQVTAIELAAGAVAVITEIVTAGRLARAERFAFTRLALDLSCTSGGRLVLRDRADVRPAAQHLAGPAILGTATVWGSCYVLVTEALDPGLVERIDADMQHGAGGTAGASLTPCGMVGRAVGTSVEPVRTALRAAHATVIEHVGKMRSK